MVSVVMFRVVDMRFVMIVMRVVIIMSVVIVMSVVMRTSSANLITILKVLRMVVAVTVGQTEDVT